MKVDWSLDEGQTKPMEYSVLTFPTGTLERLVQCVVEGINKWADDLGLVAGL